ncbi:MAG: DUF429 domain-containing protein [Thermoproteota archaeon]|nr:MAG: DUF429 domain-containing protein [Candidatus Korarchaeota archaeon]
MTDQRVVGLDLAGSENRPTGLCFLRNRKVITKLAYGDGEILEEIVSFNPSVVAIDAPLSLPAGKNLNSQYCIRKCDEELRKFGIRFFPINFAGMRKLTERGIRLKKILEEKGIEAIETYPGAFYDLMGLPRPKKRRVVGQVLRALTKKFNLEVEGVRERLSFHELDSIVCALVGLLYLKGESICLGDPKEGLMILPRPPKENRKS